ncbi:MAG TPA: YiiX/YebB-like N1pC/P60 family cysteine hydrolase, partial [Flavisolibacter sp.]|nr:YiiX/YebB-like N1pC/P60 family cysteine hydrolase [Flavisolibacter sp.]
KLDSIKATAITGDLVVRLGDDLLSYQIKFLNEADQSYSHAGIVVERGSEKFIAHITPDDPQKDGVLYTPIDSFLNPAKNLSCAVYRYNLTPAERDSFALTIEEYKSAQTRFDRVYDLTTDSEMYCSEMISKGIRKATQQRIQFREVKVPVKMQAALYNHFKKQLSRKVIAERRIMTIDNLYRVPECRLLMQLPLKFLPGQ